MKNSLAAIDVFLLRYGSVVSRIGCMAVIVVVFLFGNGGPDRLSAPVSETRLPASEASFPWVAAPLMGTGDLLESSPHDPPGVANSTAYSGEALSAGLVFVQDRTRRQPSLSVFQVGEELTYEVGYLLIKLGTIVSRCTGIDTVKGKIYYRTECLMRSYKGVPLVSLWTKFQSTVDQSLGSVSFSAKEKYKDTTYKHIHYTFPRNRDVVFVSERIGNKPVPVNYDTLALDGKRWQDGLSLLFYARAFALQRFTDRVPVLIYRTKATTTIHFGVKEETREIDAAQYPIRTMKLDGETGFTGILGLTGGFEGWFSKDWAAVPIYAKMHVIIGSVSVELISWKKKGWTPPR